MRSITAAVLAMSIMLLDSPSLAKQPVKEGRTKAQQVLQQFDKDGNGKLDAAEMRTARAAAKAQRDQARQSKATAPIGDQKAALANRPRQFDANRNVQRARPAQSVGAPPANNDSAGGSVHPSLLKKYDANHNGRLDPTEVRAIKKQWAKRP